MYKIVPVLILLTTLAQLHAQNKMAAPFDPGTQPASVYEKHTVPLDLPVSEAVVKDYLIRTNSHLQEDTSSLNLAYYRESPGGFHYTFDQTFNGITVYDGSIKVNAGKDGRIYSVMNNLKDFQSLVPAAFSLDPESLADKYQQETQASEINWEQKYLEQNGILIPAFCFTTFGATSPSSEEILVDATSGIMLKRKDRSAYAGHLTGSDTTAYGTLFSPDPCTRAHVVYGSLFTDNADMHMPVFDGLVDTVALKNVRFENGTFYLQGPYVKIEDISNFNIAPATSADGNFFFTRNESGFEDVMCYFHIDSFQRYVQHLGFTNLYNDTVRVDPHGMGNDDNSQFTPNGALGMLRFGDGGVDDAEDADVIIHEYGHALSNHASPGTNSGLERRGIDEGIGDYFAAAYSYDIDPFNWDLTFTWDGHNEFWPGRSANTGTTYSGPVGIYTNGQIYASAMMKVRLEIGNEPADRIFMQELYANSTNMNLPEAARLLLDADSMLYGGMYSYSIIKNFCDYNILAGTICEPVGIGEPLIATSDWSLYPNPSNGNLYIRFKWEDREIKEVNGLIIDMMGREFYRFNIRNGEEKFLNTKLVPGIYVVNLLANAQLLSTKKLIITD